MFRPKYFTAAVSTLIEALKSPVLEPIFRCGAVAGQPRVINYTKKSPENLVYSPLFTASC